MNWGRRWGNRRRCDAPGAALVIARCVQGNGEVDVIRVRTVARVRAPPPLVGPGCNPAVEDDVSAVGEALVSLRAQDPEVLGEPAGPDPVHVDVESAHDARGVRAVITCMTATTVCRVADHPIGAM